VKHTLCQGRRDELCRWEGEMVEEAASVAPEVESSGDEDSVHPEDAEVLDDRTAS
jgi:hypothetical protein